MGGEQLADPDLGRLEAAVFEQRRLAHMLRRRAAEIESFHGERQRLIEKAAAERDRLGEQLEGLRKESRGLSEQLVDLGGQLARSREESQALRDELKKAHYETRRAERRLDEAKRESDRRWKRLHERYEEARERVLALIAERDSVREQLQALRDELKKAHYETRRAERRLDEANEKARERARGFAAERQNLRESERALRDELKKAHYETRRAERRVAKSDRAVRAATIEREELEAGHRRVLAEMRSAEEAALRAVEERARDLSRARVEVEALVEREREWGARLKATDRALDQIAHYLRRTRASRSWRWGHGLARLFRALTFRRGSDRGAIDVALARLEGRPAAGAAVDGR